MFTREEFKRTAWKMSYEEYAACCCQECEKKGGCIHYGAYRRVPEIDGGLGLCQNLKTNKNRR